MPWLINEDQAIKDLLQGLTVSDQQTTSRPVRVWFRYPESEEREITWPFITIDTVDISRAPDREHRGLLKGVPYPVEGHTPAATGYTDVGEWPIPHDIDYQITSHARSSWHDRQITALLLGTKLPYRFGQIYVPQDETVRRLDLLGWQSADYRDEDQKRVFRKIYDIRINTELFMSQVSAVKQVLTVVPSYKRRFQFEETYRI